MGKSARNTDIAVRAMIFLLWCIFIHIVVTSSTIQYESDRTAYLKFQDFHYYIALIRSFWYHEIVSIYDPASQLMAVDNYFGVRMNHAMPLGISPTALLIMLPLSAVASFGFPLANTLWVSGFLTIYAIAVLKTYSYIQSYERNALSLFILVISVFLLSFRTVTVIFLGQTSLLGSALLLFLLLEMTLARKEQRSLRRWIIYPAIFVLSMKIHYLVLGMGILLFGGYIFELLVSFLIIGSSVGFLVAFAGPDLLTGFLEQISLFSAHTLPEFYNLASVFHTFITFRSAFAPIIGDPLSLKISMFVLSFGCISIFWICISRQYGLGKKRKYFDKVTEPQLIIALFAVLFLFLPYFGGYEDVLLIIPFAVVFLTPGHAHRKYGKIIAVVPFLLIILNQTILFSSDHLWLFWVMKALILVYLFFFQKGAILQRVEFA